MYMEYILQHFILIPLLLGEKDTAKHFVFSLAKLFLLKQEQTEKCWTGERNIKGD